MQNWTNEFLLETLEYIFPKFLAVFPKAVTPLTHLCHQIRA